MEFIYVVKREVLQEMLPEKGVISVSLDELNNISSHGFFIERAFAETDPSLKQLIPYVIIRRKNDIFLFKRLKGSGEKRLHNLYSVGVGGHINPEESKDEVRDFSVIKQGALRELKEETDLDFQGEFKIIGLLNDDSNEVGKVHTGIVMEIEVDGDIDLKSAEEGVIEGGFTKLSTVYNLLGSEDFETWSQLVLSAIEK